MKKAKKAKRRFEVWLDKQISGCEPTIEILEMSANATDKECEKACIGLLARYRVE